MQLVTATADQLDPYQFVYKTKGGLDDACLTLYNLVASHLVFYSWTFCLCLNTPISFSHTYYYNIKHFDNKYLIPTGVYFVPTLF